MKLDRSKLWFIMASLAALSLTVWGASTVTRAPLATPSPTMTLEGAPAEVQSAEVQSYKVRTAEATPAAAQPVEQRDLVLPTGTLLRIRLDNSVSTASARVGDHFSGTVVSPASVDRSVVLPVGATAHGYVVNSAASGRLKGHAVLSLRLTSVAFDGRTMQLATASDTRVSAGHKKRNLAWIGGGASGGLLIGALAAGPVGAVIGAGSGAAVGVAGAAITGRRQVKLPAETELNFRLSRPLRVPHAAAG